MEGVPCLLEAQEVRQFHVAVQKHVPRIDQFWRTASLEWKRLKGEVSKWSNYLISADFLFHQAFPIFKKKYSFPSIYSLSYNVCDKIDNQDGKDMKRGLWETLLLLNLKLDPESYSPFILLHSLLPLALNLPGRSISSAAT